MSRLKKIAENKEFEKEKELNLEVARKAIDSIELCIVDIMEQYKSLFTKLNSISDEYPKLYNQLKKLVEFPTEYDTRDIVKMKEDIDELKEKYKDDEYLSEVIGIEIEEK